MDRRGPGALRKLLEHRKAVNQQKPPYDFGPIEYCRSTKGSLQLLFEGFPYTRHSCKGGKEYWRCVQFKSLGCRSRVRTCNERIETVEFEHNHELVRERRKKGALKQLMQARKREKSQAILDQFDVVEFDLAE
ncbi:hypothetical protein quinque_012328 [Culex quinquefasciatus]